MAFPDLKPAWDTAVKGYDDGVSRLWSSPSNWLDAPSLHLGYSARFDQLKAQWEGAKTRQQAITAIDGMAALASEMGVIVDPKLAREQLSDFGGAVAAGLKDTVTTGVSLGLVVAIVAVVVLLAPRR